MQEDEYWAHAPSPKYKYHPKAKPEMLHVHLENVWRHMQKEVAKLDLPWLTAMLPCLKFICFLHDFGKVKIAFKEKISGIPEPEPYAGSHTPIITRLVYEIKKVFSNVPSYIIAGHHAGLPDGKKKLYEICEKSKKSPYDDMDHLLSVAKLPQFSDVNELLLMESSVLPKYDDPKLLTFLIRFMFGLFTTCDHDATYDYYFKLYQDVGPKPSPYKPIRQTDFLNAKRYDHLLKYLRNKSSEGRKKADTKQAQEVQELRSKYLSTALKVAGGPQRRTFSLDIATGGGKTLTGLAFCYKYALKHGLKRIIYVAPYLNIIDQTVKVFSEALKINQQMNYKFICEQHSISNTVAKLEKYYSKLENNSELDDRDFAFSLMREERWRQPLIVTTMVQFVESLFANRVTRCQKIVNMSHSVIFFDEFQMLPLDMRKDVTEDLSYLTKYCNSTILFASATNTPWQQIYDEKPYSIIKTTEVPKSLQRTIVERQGKYTISSLVARLSKESQTFCVVNTRTAAQKIALKLKKSGKHVRCLTTRQNKNHRLEVLKHCHERLQTGKEIILISTQSIEAGVDIDFPLGYRQFAPLESIIHCAGRVNREGKLIHGGRLFLFDLEESVLHDRHYQSGIEYVKTLLENHKTLDIYNPDILRKYFESKHNKFYDSRSDSSNKSVSEHREKQRFKSIAKTMRVINDKSISILAPRNTEEQDQIIQLIKAIEKAKVDIKNGVNHTNLQFQKRELLKLNISVFQKELDNMRDANLTQIYEDELGFPLEFITPDIYDELVGVQSIAMNDNI